MRQRSSWPLLHDWVCSYFLSLCDCLYKSSKQCSIMRKWVKPVAHISWWDEAPVPQTPVALCGLWVAYIVQIQEDLSVPLPQHHVSWDGHTRTHTDTGPIPWNCKAEGICAHRWIISQMTTPDALWEGRGWKERGESLVLYLCCSENEAAAEDLQQSALPSFSPSSLSLHLSGSSSPLINDQWNTVMDVAYRQGLILRRLRGWKCTPGHTVSSSSSSSVHPHFINNAIVSQGAVDERMTSEVSKATHYAE